MPGETSMADVLRNMLQHGDLSFRDFMEVALYHPEFGYYTGRAHPAGKAGDFVTAPTLSPAFSFAIARLVREFSSRFQGEVCSFVDIGAGEGGLVNNVAAEAQRLRGSEAQREIRFFAIDRALSSRAESRDLGGGSAPPAPPDPSTSLGMTWGGAIQDVPRDGVHLIFSNELYDAFPFARLVQRGEHLHELWVAERDGGLDWVEREAPATYEDYFAERGIELAEGQFVDLSLEWEAFHREVVERFDRALFVTFDYGHPAEKLFSSRMRRFGTAAAYSGQRVSRDLLANPGEQDLTAHINFSDLQRAPATTLYFDRMNKFLLALGITEHPSFRDETDFQAREDARRLVLPDGIGEDLRVLVQGKNVPVEGWSFQRHLY